MDLGFGLVLPLETLRVSEGFSFCGGSVIQHGDSDEAGDESHSQERTRLRLRGSAKNVGSSQKNTLFQWNCVRPLQLRAVVSRVDPEMAEFGL